MRVSAVAFQCCCRHFLNGGFVLAFVMAIVGPSNSALAQIFARLDSSAVASVTAISTSGSWGDFDGDGDLDLSVATQGPEQNLLFRNDGEGVLTRVFIDPLTSEFTNALMTRWIDFDNDGDLDQFVPDLNGNDALYRNDSNSVFTKVHSYPLTDSELSSRIASWADYDNDGDLDVFVTRRNNHGNNLFRNQSNGKFTKISEGDIGSSTGNSTCAAWSDVNGDSYIDLFVGNTGGGNNLFYWNTGASFVESLTSDPVTDGGNSGNCSWIDYDNDGDFDLFVGNTGTQANFLYENIGGSALRRVLTHSITSSHLDTQGHAWVDIDNDGDLDLYVTNRGDPNVLYINDGAGDLVQSLNPILVSGDVDDATTSWADYDGDGDLDVFVARLFAPDMLFRNELQNSSWLQIDLLASTSNHFGVGAKVTVGASIGGRSSSQVRMVSAGESNPQSGYTLHFGLGDATVADMVSVEWPSGRTQNIVDVERNQRITLLESNAIGVGVDSATPDQMLHVSAPYPNPTAGRATIEVTGARRGDLEVSVYDLLGRRLHSTIVEGGPVRRLVPVDLSSLPIGSYFVVVENERSRKSRIVAVTR